jgi:L-alanine-DL-glutamate epimerase-like enolase superfamily enzyme
MSTHPRIVSTGTERISLPLATAFRTSRGSTQTTENLLVRVTDEDGRIGRGAGAPSAYYGETAASAGAVLPALLEAVERIGDPHAQQAIAADLAAQAPGEAAARAAVSIAVHDLAARQTGEPLYRRLGLDPERAPPTSYTIGIADPGEMAARTRHVRAAGYPILKLKLGTDRDRARVSAVREAAPEATLRVDANGDWTPQEAIENAEWLAEANVEFLEQPVPAADIEGLRRVSESVPFPVAADESCVAAEDVPRVAKAADIVVVKLMKCGGVRAAQRHIATAHAHGLDVMIGCMIESDASIAGACHLAPLCEYADLDGSLLLASDPCSGVEFRGGQVDLEAVALGTGARESDEW